mgnify:CR=1 FL=1
MKNIIYLIISGLVLLGFNSCDPNEEIYDDLPEYDSVRLANMDKIPYISTYTLTEEDYELSSNESVSNYHNFSDYSPAADYLPEIVNQLFLAEAGAETIITYNYYKPLSVGDTIAEYELDTSDYSNEYNNFDNFNSIYSFINENYTGDRGDLVVLTYAWYQGGGVTDTLTNSFINLGENKWTVAYKLTSTDYNAMGQSYPNFSDDDEAKHRVSLYLETLNTDIMEYQYAQEGDEAYILYDLYDGGVNQHIMHLVLNSNGWTVIGDVVQKSASLTSNGQSWSFVPPIEFIETDKLHTREYTLTNADYELVGNGNYHNFDVRPGANEEPVEVRIDKISTILKANFSDLAIGDVFLVHYDIYNGSNETWDITLEAIPKE